MFKPYFSVFRVGGVQVSAPRWSCFEADLATFLQNSGEVFDRTFGLTYTPHVLLNLFAFLTQQAGGGGDMAFGHGRCT